MTDDKHAFRVTLICKCAGDYAEGYGPTLDEAKRAAYGFFRCEHGRAKPDEEIHEETVTLASGAKFYQEVEP